MEGSLSYVARRLMWVPLILFVVSFVSFALARLGPGDPISIAAGQFRDKEVLDRVRKARGLDKPIHEQYVIYIEGVLTRGDFGESFRYQGRSVTEVILPAIWRSAQYNLIALLVVFGVGIPAGVYAARRQGSWADPSTISVFLLLQSLHSLVTIPVLLVVFALKLGILPASGWPRECEVSLGFLDDRYSCIGVLSNEAIIPLIVLSLPGIASIARYTRAFTLNVLGEDYVRTARSKGLREMQVMSRHVLRNALLPLSTIIIFALVGLMEGSFITETLTGIPGVGRLAFESVTGRDYDMIMALTMIGAFAFVMASIVVDVVYTLIDPRIRYGSRGR